MKIVKPLIRVACLLCILFMLASPPPVSAEEDVPVSSITESKMAAFFDQAIPEQMEKRNIPGTVVMVVKDGKILYEKGYGFADLENNVPVDPQSSVFHIASITKLFTWTAVMQLVEQGKLELSRDVNEYLDFKIPATFDEPVTLEHLLTQSSGFEENNFDYVAATVDQMDGLGPWLKTHIPARVRRPGEFSAYSNYGTALAGYVVERVSGMPYEAYIERNIFQPLQMTHSSVRLPLPADVAAHLAVGYRWSEGAYLADSLTISQAPPAGAIRATAGDMANFMIAHLQEGEFSGSRILNAPTAQLMQAHHFAHDPRVNGFAYGFYEMSQNGVRIIGHGGDVACFHSLMALFPEHDMGLFVSYNGMGGSLQQGVILSQFTDYFYPEDAADLVEQAGLENSQTLSGYYRMTRSSFTTVESVMALVSPTQVFVMDDGNLTMRGPLGVQRFSRIEGLAFQQVDGDKLLIFRQDEDGQMYAFDNDNPIFAYQKLPWIATPSLHFPLLGGGLLLILSVFPVAIFRLIRRRKSGVQAPRLTRALRWMLLAEGLMTLLFLVFFGIAFSNIPAFTRGEGTMVRLALVFPLLMVVIAVGLAAGNVYVWRSQSWRAWERVHFSLVSLGLLAFLWSLNYWNLIGWKLI